MSQAHADCPHCRQDGSEAKHIALKEVRIALAGNPNCGKTTAFNEYTGTHQHVGNYPGVTVDKKEGYVSIDGVEVLMVDLPGTYSLTAYSQEEIVTRAVLAPEKAEEPVSKKAEPEEPAEEKSVTQDDLCRLRSIHVGFVSPSQLKRAKAEGKLDHLLAQRDEIEVPLDTGGTVTVVCCYVTPTSARFVFKDCWDEGVMNDEATNKTGYFKSKGRKHVLEDIYPHIAAEWREIIVPRTFVETIEGERVEYSDPLWLPSATDVFGTPDGSWWKDGDDDFQLPVFARERDRVKECGDKGTYSWWLRSVRAGITSNFCRVNADGSANANDACISIGFAPGFDI